MTLESIEKLREWVQHIDENRQLGALAGTGKQGLINIADAIQAEVDEKYMLLPVDADNVPLRIGDDVVSLDTGQSLVVTGIADDAVQVSCFSTWESGDHFTHFKPRTVEDVLKYVVRVFTGRELDYMGEVERNEFNSLAAELRMRDANEEG